MEQAKQIEISCRHDAFEWKINKPLEEGESWQKYIHRSFRGADVCPPVGLHILVYPSVGERGGRRVRGIEGAVMEWEELLRYEER